MGEPGRPIAGVDGRTTGAESVQSSLFRGLPSAFEELRGEGVDFADLDAPQRRVEAVPGQGVLVAPLFDEFAVVHHEDIGVSQDRTP
jgi:hypothetical protein